MSHVLIADDHPICRRVLSRLLRKRGLRVTEARDGLETLNLTRATRPDLILMDISMPHLDGLTCCRVLKSDPETADIPIIAITGHPPHEMYDAARAAGCIGCLPKPVPATHLLMIIAALFNATLREFNSEPPPSL